MREFRPAFSEGQQIAGDQSLNPTNGFRVSQTSTAPYTEPVDTSRVGRCSAKDNTCKGFKVKGSDLCAGHKRSAEKADTDAAE